MVIQLILCKGPRGPFFEELMPNTCSPRRYILYSGRHSARSVYPSYRQTKPGMPFQGPADYIACSKSPLFRFGHHGNAHSTIVRECHIARGHTEARFSQFQPWSQGSGLSETGAPQQFLDVIPDVSTLPIISFTIVNQSVNRPVNQPKMNEQNQQMPIARASADGFAIQ